MKKTLALCLAALMLAMPLASCAQTEETPTDTTASSADTTAADITTEAVTTEDPLADNLPEELDFGGYNFRIGSTEKETRWYEYIVRDEQNGETLNDAIFDANLAVADRFGVTFSYVPMAESNTNCYKALVASAQAGDEVYDIATIHDGNSTVAMLQGVLRDVHELKYINLEKPWWPEHTTNALTVNGRMYQIANSMSYYGLYSTRAIFFNKGLMKDMGIAMPYDKVREGKWYFDDLMTMTKDVYSDLDNDGVRSLGDRYGFSITGATYCWQESFGIDAFQLDGSGKITENWMSDRNVTAMQKLNQWVFGGTPGVWYAAKHKQVRDDGCGGMFAKGNVLMACHSLGVMTESCLESDVEFGIVPLPKMDEEQKNYYGGSVDNPVVIPITTKDMERTGAIIEAMSAEGYKKVQPAYTESVMKARYATDKDSVEMLDILFNNRLLAAGYLYAPSKNRVQLMQDVVWAQATSNASVVSAYESIKNESTARLNELNEFFFKAKQQ